MFLATTRSETVVEPAPVAFVGVDQEEPAFASVNRQPVWLLGDSRHEVRVAASRVNVGDAFLERGCA